MTNKDCSQEPRLVQLETALAAISATLTDVKDLLKSSIQADERIRALQQKYGDQETRLRSLESGHASTRWMDRVVWAVVAAALALFFKNIG